MDDHRFDEITRSLTSGASRRGILKRVGALAAGLLATRGHDALAQPGCRQEGHPCEGNQECCPGLECRVTGPGNAERCAVPPKQCPHKACNGSKGCCPPCYTCKHGCCVPCPCGKGGYTEKKRK